MLGKDPRNQQTMPLGKFIGAFTDSLNLPQDRQQICLLGRSNSGKSSLLAALMRNPSIVKTSSKPGSTRTINFYDYAGLYLVDLPGYGYVVAGRKTKELLSDMIYSYLNQNEKRILGGILLLDCVREPQKEEFAVAEFFHQIRTPLILCFTKADKLNQKEKAALEKKIGQYQEHFSLVLLLSAHKRTGLRPLVDFIASLGGNFSG